MGERNFKEGALLKKDASRVGRGLLFYTIINFIVVFVDLVIRMIKVFISASNDLEVEAGLDAVLKYTETAATSMIAGVLIGTLFMIFLFRKYIDFKALFTKQKDMSIKEFISLLCIFMGGQFVFNVGSSLLEKIFNLLGYTIMADIESAATVSTTISMFIYAGFIGPIVEEILYRGIVLRSFEKYGKVFAIVTSALLFGIMHGNLPQGLFAFWVGLVLGYVAIEYSIVWSIGLHIINNCIFGDLLSYATGRLSEITQELLNFGIWILLFILGIICLWKKKHILKNYIVQNPVEKKSYVQALTPVWMLIFLGLELSLTISGIVKL